MKCSILMVNYACIISSDIKIIAVVRRKLIEFLYPITFKKKGLIY